MSTLIFLTLVLANSVAANYVQFPITNFRSSLTTNALCLTNVCSMKNYASTDGLSASLYGSSGAYFASNLNIQGKSFNASQYDSVQVVVKRMTLQSIKLYIDYSTGSCTSRTGSTYSLPIPFSSFKHDILTGYQVAYVPLTQFTNLPRSGLVSIGIIELTPSSTELKLVSLSFVKTNPDTAVLPVSGFQTGSLSKNAFCNSQGAQLTTYAYTTDGLLNVNMKSGTGGYFYTQTKTPTSVNGAVQCMDLSRYDYYQLVVKQMTMNSIGLFIKSSNTGNCNADSTTGYYTATAADFVKDSSTGYYVANVPFGKFQPPINPAGTSALGLSNFSNTTQLITVVAVNVAKNTSSRGDFIWRNGASLMKGTSPLRFASFNVPDLFRASGEYPNELDPREQEDLIKTIATYANGSSAVARPYVLGAIGWRGTIVAADQWDETNFRRVDNAIALANKYQVKLIIPLIDEWSWFGGIKEFCSLYLSTCDSFGNAFFTNEAVITGFQRYISYFLNRVNTVNGLKYKDDPAILAWELGNELGVKGSDGRPQTLPPLAWTSRIANYIKSIDSNHLVSDGGFVQPGLTWSTDNLLIPSVDLYSEHMYSATSNTDFGSRCIASRNIVRRYGKAYFVGEYGIVSDQTTLTNLLSTCFQDIVNGSGEYGVSALAGTLIWSLRGRTVQSKLGFYTHNENNDNRFWAYHYPGFPGNVSLGIASDEIKTVSEIATKANELGQVLLNNGEPVASASMYASSAIDSPLIVNSQVNSKNTPSFRFFGSVGSKYYQLSGSIDNITFYSVNSNISEFSQIQFNDTSALLNCQCNRTLYYKLNGVSGSTVSSPTYFSVTSASNSSASNTTCYWNLNANKTTLCS